MLEQKIEELNKNVKDLADIILFFTEQLRDRWTQISDVPPVPKEETTTQADNTITPEELQSMCLALVRNKKSNKAQIKTIMEDLGASLIKDLPPEKLPILKQRLEGLQ